ncbi:hypothetical protein MASR2M17_05170 [Aminivibrio sp.]
MQKLRCRFGPTRLILAVVTGEDFFELRNEGPAVETWSVDAFIQFGLLTLSQVRGIKI